MQAAEFMEQFVHDVIAQYEAEVLPSGLLYLELRMKGHGVLIIEEIIKHRQMRVCYWLFDADGNRIPEPEILFYIDPYGHWIPYEIHRHTAGNHVYADLDLANGEWIVIDAKHQAALACFADFWAEILRAQGWIDHADKSITQPKAWLEDEEEQAQPPDVALLWDFVDEYGKCLATDGCWCPPEGTCEHGHPSWLVALGLV
jgi:hypothetical protein